MSGAPNVKLVTVGDGAVGKTALLRCYADGKMTEAYEPTIFDTMNANTTFRGEPVCVTFYDSAGQEEYAHLRKLCYPKTDCFLLCFAVNSEASFANVSHVWVPEIREQCPNTPILLVGTKVDLRQDAIDQARKAASASDEKGDEAPEGEIPGAPDGFISTLRGEILADKIDAFAYAECCALTGEGIAFVIDKSLDAWRIYRNRRAKPKSRGCSCGCNIL